MFMCGSHWGRLPAQHKAAVWRFYRHGQENTKDPSLEYLVASHRAILALATIDAQPADKIVSVRQTLTWLEGKLEAQSA
jgi:hypothetical protein